MNRKYIIGLCVAACFGFQHSIQALQTSFPSKNVGQQNVNQNRPITDATTPSNEHQEKYIALTIDDLPFVSSRGHDSKKAEREHERWLAILNTLIAKKVPATGFVIAGNIGKHQWAWLEDFKNAGFTLGNHTYSHEDLGRRSASEYINNIAKADAILTPLMSHPKYFRYPYLDEGRGEKKAEVLAYLSAHDYVVAPVTIDSKDFVFNTELYRIPFRQRPAYLNTMKQRYLNYIWKQTLRAEKNTQHGPVKAILLIHANMLNSYFLGDIIDLYRNNGYRFISIAEALNEPDNKAFHAAKTTQRADGTNQPS